MTPRIPPAVLARHARALLPRFLERLALLADATSDALAHELRLVAWDREQLLGLIQGRIAALAQGRFVPSDRGPVRVLERRNQPLEALEAVWVELLQGKATCVELACGACSATRELLAELAAELPVGAMLLRDDVDAGDADDTTMPFVAHAPAADDPTTWPRTGVEPAVRRVALVDEHADRELAAYVLARTCLRRSGTDPRGVHRAYVVGSTERLRPHLVRLWVGAQLGPADDPSSFAGPVDEVTRREFVDLHGQWQAAPQVETWCPGGVLHRAGESGPYLAPGLFVANWPAPELELVGPMCCVVRCTADQARADIEAAAREGAGVVQIGGRPIGYAGVVRHVRGAVLVERLPPGLPEPRPV